MQLPILNFMSQQKLPLSRIAKERRGMIRYNMQNGREEGPEGSSSASEPQTLLSVAPCISGECGQRCGGSRPRCRQVLLLDMSTTFLRLWDSVCKNKLSYVVNIQKKIIKLYRTIFNYYLVLTCDQIDHRWMNSDKKLPKPPHEAPPRCRRPQHSHGWHD